MVALGQVDMAGNDLVVKSIQVGGQLAGRYPATPAAVTQATNRTTGVTINASSGQITTNTTALATQTQATFVVTNSFVSANDIIIVSIKSGMVGTGTDVYVTAVAAGSFSLTLDNNGAGNETGAIVITFAVVKVQG